MHTTFLNPAEPCRRIIPSWMSVATQPCDAAAATVSNYADVLATNAQKDFGQM
jgi:hypothetical protein